MATIQKNTIFTNVLKTDDGGVWWEGMNEPPAHGIDWTGKDWTPASKTPGAHPNSRFACPASQCPSISPHWEDPQGVPISAIFFGARRARVAPLICQSRNWQHGVYLGSTMASETTAAAAGKVGVVRRDPMAMLPFIGYHVGDYFAHWLAMGRSWVPKPLRFSTSTGFAAIPKTNEFLWPGFRENFRAILWALDRCDGSGDAVETPMGFVPTPKALNLSGLEMTPQVLEALLKVDPADWKEDLADQRAFFEKVGDRLPPVLRQEQDAFAKRLGFK